MIEASAIDKRFGATSALHNLTFSLESGQLLGLLGTNGSGKSTLIRMLAGITRPDAGSLKVLGYTPGQASKQDVSYMPELDHFYPRWTAKTAFEFHSQFYLMNRARYWKALEFLAVPNQTRFRDLSKGNRTRLRLAVVLAREAQVFLFDEPLNGIDPIMRQEILRALAIEFRLENACYVLATHQILEAESLFDRVLVLEKGQTLLEGDAETLRMQWGSSILDAVRSASRPLPLELQEKVLA